MGLKLIVIIAMFLLRIFFGLFPSGLVETQLPAEESGNVEERTQDEGSIQGLQVQGDLELVLGEDESFEIH